MEIEFGDETIRLGPGGLARVDAPVVRRLRNISDEDAIVVVTGGKGGYVGRDGRLPEGADRVGGPIDEPAG